MKRHRLWTMVGMMMGACGGGMYGSNGALSPVTTTTPVSPSATSSSTPSNAKPAGFVIAIQNMGYSPLNLAAPAGATVTVINLDGMAHSLTSEPTSGSYRRGAPSGVTPFDTGPFSSGQRTFTVPNANPGTVLPFFCTVHTSTMTTPNGTITIDPSAMPATTTSTSMPMSTSAPSTTNTPAPMPLPMPSMPPMGGY